MGRTLYYYAKHITYNLQTQVLFDRVKIQLPTSNFEENFKISLKSYPSKRLKSIILDCFDFNLNWIENEIKEVDFTKEITQHQSDHEFLKKKVDNFYLN